MNTLSIGSVLSRSLGVVKRNLVPFVLLAAIINVPLSLWDLATTSAFMETQAELQKRQSGPPGDDPAHQEAVSSFILNKLVIFVAFLFATALLWGALLYGTFRDLAAKPATASEMIHHGLQVLVPMTLLSVLVLIIIASLAMILMFAGAIVATSFAGQEAEAASPRIAWVMFAAAGIGLLPFLTMLYMVFPALALERCGVIEALKRSSALTAGQRIPITGLILIVMSPVIALVVLNANPEDPAVATGNPSHLVFASGLLLSILLSVWQAAVMGVVYRDLSARLTSVGAKDRIEDIFR